MERLLHDDDYCAQEKFDGRHLLVRKQDGQIEGINKKGLIVGLPATVDQDIRNLSGDFIPDGESIGDDVPRLRPARTERRRPAALALSDTAERR